MTLQPNGEALRGGILWARLGLPSSQQSPIPVSHSAIGNFWNNTLSPPAKLSQSEFLSYLRVPRIVRSQRDGKMLSLGGGGKK